MLHNRSLSIEHEVWIRKISEMLNSNEIKNFILDNSNGPDIIAVNDGKRVAIEYETGSKSFDSTSKMMDSRIKAFHKLIIVTRESSIEYYKKGFEAKGVIVISTAMIESIIDLVLKITKSV